MNELRLDPRNARRHSDRNKRQIKQSLETVGAGRSILADADGIVRAGNGVFAEWGDKPIKIIETDGKELVVVQRTDLRGQDAIRAAALDNLVADSSAFDYDAAILAEIARDDDVIRAIANEDAKLRELLRKENGTGEKVDPGELIDRAELLQEKWQCKADDIWTASGHFWICGDCREAETWKRLLEAAKVEKVNGVFTSPPYAEQRKKQYGGIPTEQYVEWWGEVQARVREHLAADGSFFVNIKPHCENGERVLYVFDLVTAMRRKWEWRFVDELCWNRPSIPGNMGDRFKNGFEPVYHFSQNGCKFRPQNVLKTDTDLSGFVTYDQTDGEVTMGAQYNGYAAKHSVRSKNYDGALPSNVIDARQSDSGVQGHGATFPTELVDFFIRAYSDPGDVWLDNFAGSGTAIVAAHQNERRGLGIEMLPKYCAVICERLANLGLRPQRIQNVGM